MGPSPDLRALALDRWALALIFVCLGFLRFAEATLPKAKVCQGRRLTEGVEEDAGWETRPNL